MRKYRVMVSLIPNDKKTNQKYVEYRGTRGTITGLGRRTVILEVYAETEDIACDTALQHMEPIVALFIDVVIKGVEEINSFTEIKSIDGGSKNE